MISDFFVHSVTILNPTTRTDRYSATVEDWDSPTSTTVLGWIARSSESEDRNAEHDTLVSTCTLRLPAGTSITGRSRVTYGGDTFCVVGEPNRAPTPSGEHHVRCRLTLREG